MSEASSAADSGTPSAPPRPLVLTLLMWTSWALCAVSALLVLVESVSTLVGQSRSQWDMLAVLAVVALALLGLGFAIRLRVAWAARVGGTLLLIALALAAYYSASRPVACSASPTGELLCDVRDLLLALGALAWAPWAGWSPASQRYFGSRRQPWQQKLVSAAAVMALLPLAVGLTVLTFHQRAPLTPPPPRTIVDPCTAVESRVARLARESMLGESSRVLEPRTRLKEDLRADRLDRVELQGFLIDEFALPGTTDLTEEATIGELAARIRRLKGCPDPP